MTKLGTRVGRRGAALLFFALLGAVYCYGLLDPAQPIGPTYAWAQSVLPLWAWALLWGSAGALCAVCAFLDHDSVAFGAMIAVSAWWGLLILAGWLLGDVDRGYVSAAIWLALAGFVYVIGGGLGAKRHEEHR
jgi:hypothetical protein